MLDGARHQRLARRPLQGLSGGEQRADGVQRPDLRRRQEGVHHQQRGEDDLRGPGGHEHDAAVEVVCQRASPEAEHDQRNQLDDAERANGEVRTRQLVELVGHSDVRDHPAQVEDGPGPEEQPEVARLTQRRRVDADPSESLLPAHAQHGDRAVPAAATRFRGPPGSATRVVGAPWHAEPHHGEADGGRHPRHHHVDHRLGRVPCRARDRRAPRRGEGRRRRRRPERARRGRARGAGRWPRSPARRCSPPCGA